MLEFLLDHVSANFSPCKNHDGGQQKGSRVHATKGHILLYGVDPNSGSKTAQICWKRKHMRNTASAALSFQFLFLQTLSHAKKTVVVSRRDQTSRSLACLTQNGKAQKLSQIYKLNWGAGVLRYPRRERYELHNLCRQPRVRPDLKFTSVDTDYAIGDKQIGRRQGGCGLLSHHHFMRKTCKQSNRQE